VYAWLNQRSGSGLPRMLSGPMSANTERENTMAQVNPPATEEAILEALRAEGITNLKELAQKTLEVANSREGAGKVDQVFYGGHYVFWI
jgi:hypothetical protein